MGTTQPIRDKDELKNFIAYYEVAHPNIRNYTMIILGLYTALRISDVLNLKWKDVYYFEKDCFLDHLLIHEQKTGKVNEIALNSHVIKALDCYRKTRKPDAEDYIFSKPTTPAHPLCRSQAYRIVRRAADETLCVTHVSCHSLRKTFGYQYMMRNQHDAMALSTLQDMLNHSSQTATLHYIGLDDEVRNLYFSQIDYGVDTHSENEE